MKRLQLDKIREAISSKQEPTHKNESEKCQEC